MTVPENGSSPSDKLDLVTSIFSFLSSYLTLVAADKQLLLVDLEANQNSSGDSAASNGANSRPDSSEQAEPKKLKAAPVKAKPVDKDHPPKVKAKKIHKK